MPTTKTGLKYPKKGSQAAYDWADKMQKARASKKKRKVVRQKRSY